MLIGRDFFTLSSIRGRWFIKSPISYTNGGIIQAKMSPIVAKNERNTRKTATPRLRPFFDKASTGCFAALITTIAMNKERRISLMSHANLRKISIPTPIRMVLIDISIFGSSCFPFSIYLSYHESLSFRKREGQNGLNPTFFQRFCTF